MRIQIYLILEFMRNVAEPEMNGILQFRGNLCEMVSKMKNYAENSEECDNIQKMQNRAEIFSKEQMSHLIVASVLVNSFSQQNMIALSA